MMPHGNEMLIAVSALNVFAASFIQIKELVSRDPRRSGA